MTWFDPQMHMFIARYCDLLNVVISCDGCERMAPWHRYRCLQCMDMDLCKTCFLSELIHSTPQLGQSHLLTQSLDKLSFIPITCLIRANPNVNVCVFNQVVQSLRATRTTMRWWTWNMPVTTARGSLWAAGSIATCVKTLTCASVVTMQRSIQTGDIFEV